MASLRLFIAIETPPEIKSHMIEIVSTLQSANADVRWNRPDKLHVTLKFLGKTNPDQSGEVVASMKKIAQHFPSFQIIYSGVGCFPGKHEPRIIWVGVETNQILTSLAEAIDSEISSHGFAREERNVHPHITIGRVKSQRNASDLIRTMESITFESQPVRISTIALFNSETNPGGSNYTILDRAPLWKLTPNINH